MSIIMVIVRLLIWDDFNTNHMVERHGVTPEEVDQVCQGEHFTTQGHTGRLRVIGPTHVGRMLTIILAPEPEPGVYYPVTARPASRKERQRYEDATEGGEEAA